MTQENQTGKKPGEDLTQLSSRKNRIHYERIEIYTIATQTTNILLLLHVENLLTQSRASSETTNSFFLGFLARTSTPACVSLSSLAQQLKDHQALHEISFLIILSMCEGNHLSQEIHTHNKQSHQDLRELLGTKPSKKEAHSFLSKKPYKNVLRVSFLYLGQNIKPYMSYGLRAELEILQKKHSARLSIGQV